MYYVRSLKYFLKKDMMLLILHPFILTCQIGQINTSLEFDENCLECVKNKQEKENDNT